MAGVGTADRANRTKGQKRQFRTHSGQPIGRNLTSRSERPTAPAHHSNGKPLPDDHAAAALWWRICRHLPPSLSAQINPNATFTSPWESKLAELVGAERAEALQASPWWPALVTAVDHGLQRGWRIEDLLRATTSGPHAAAVDQCQAMVWRISVALDPLPDDEPHEPIPAPHQMTCSMPIRQQATNA